MHISSLSMDLQAKSHHTTSLLTETGSGFDNRRMSRIRRFFSLVNLKLFPMLATSCKMVALLGRPRGALISGNIAIGTLFGCRKGKVILALQEDPISSPIFVVQLPIPTYVFLKEMSSGLVRIALESESNSKTYKKRLLEESVWTVYCNGRKTGFSVRKKNVIDDETGGVMKMLRGVSMGAGVLPSLQGESDHGAVEAEITYMRARFERVIGSKDSEAFYMISPEGSAGGPELSIFFVRTS